MLTSLSLDSFLKKSATAIAILLLIIMFVLEITSAIQESQIIDEGVHLTAGYSYLLNKKIELNPEHPPLIKLLTASLIWPLTPSFPWSDLQDANQWDLAGKFFYDLGNNADLMLFLGRLPVMFCSLILGWLIFILTRQLAGNKAALIALLLYVFDANILAHSRYITTDIAASLAFFSSIFFLYKYTQKPTNKNLIIFTIIFALGQVIKFSTILLWPIILFYGFFSKINSKQFFKLFFWTIIVTYLAIVVVYFGHPNAYVQGMGLLADHERGGHYSYLLGQYNDHGFWYYFQVAFLVKTPLIILILLITAITIFIIKNFKAHSWQHVPLMHWLIIAFPVYYFIASMINSINIGIRHLLPIYPFIIIFIAITLFSRLWKNLIIKIAAALLIIFFIAESLITYPNYLPYFSLLIGKPSHGYKYLLDSNLDWGQDLKKLKKYLDENNVTEPIYLEYFGKASPKYYQINYKNLSEDVKTGWIAISIQHILWPDSKYKWLLSEKPRIIIGGSIYVYYIQK